MRQISPMDVASQMPISVFGAVVPSSAAAPDQAVSPFIQASRRARSMSRFVDMSLSIDLLFPS